MEMHYSVVVDVLMCADVVLFGGLLDAALEVILTVAHNNKCVCVRVCFFFLALAAKKIK